MSDVFNVSIEYSIKKDTLITHSYEVGGDKKAADVNAATNAAIGNVNSNYESALQEVNIEDDPNNAHDLKDYNNYLKEWSERLSAANAKISENEIAIGEKQNFIDGFQATMDQCEQDKGQLQTTLNGLDQNSDDPDVKAQIETLKKKIEELDTSYKNAKTDKEKMEGEKKALEEENDKLKNDASYESDGLYSVPNAQGGIERANAKIKELTEALDDEKQAVIETANAGRASATEQINTAEANALAQVKENELPKKDEEGEAEGFDYSKLDGANVFEKLSGNVELKNMFDNDKAEAINTKLTNMGLSSQINTSDGISAAEMNMILMAEGKGNFSENDKYSKNELNAVLNAIKNDDITLEVKNVSNDSFGGEHDKVGELMKGNFGVQLNTQDTNQAGNIKYWTTTEEGQDITSSIAYYYDKQKGHIDAYANNSYSTNDNGETVITTKFGEREYKDETFGWGESGNKIVTNLGKDGDRSNYSASLNNADQRAKDIYEGIIKVDGVGEDDKTLLDEILNDSKLSDVEKLHKLQNFEFRFDKSNKGNKFEEKDKDYNMNLLDSAYKEVRYSVAKKFSSYEDVLGYFVDAEKIYNDTSLSYTEKVVKLNELQNNLKESSSKISNKDAVGENDYVNARRMVQHAWYNATNRNTSITLKDFNDTVTDENGLVELTEKQFNTYSNIVNDWELDGKNDEYDVVKMIDFALSLPNNHSKHKSDVDRVGKKGFEIGNDDNYWIDSYWKGGIEEYNNNITTDDIK